MAQGPRVDDVCRAHGLGSRGSERRALGLGVWQAVSSGNSGYKALLKRQRYLGLGFSVIGSFYHVCYSVVKMLIIRFYGLGFSLRR